MLRTTTQRRALCPSCPIARVADVVGDTCSLLIIRDLLEGPRRFNDFECSLRGVSTRTVSGKLKQLEKSGLLKRSPYSKRPPRMQYSLTKKGRALKGIVNSMRRYGEKHL